MRQTHSSEVRQLAAATIEAVQAASPEQRGGDVGQLLARRSAGKDLPPFSEQRGGGGGGEEGSDPRPQILEIALLPDIRVTPFSRPFAVVGLDYFGPMLVTVGRWQEKRYGVLFTCLSTRAVHLEVAHSLTTDSAIMGIRPMIRQRGTPSQLYTDNGTNIHGADAELHKALQELDQQKLSCDLSATGINWHFNPAPHMGRACERLVRSVKTAIGAVLNERAPKDEVLRTLMIEAECLVNGRPLTHVSVDTNDAESLTPNHFLIGTSSPDSLLPSVFTSADLCLRNKRRISQALADMFWKRWVQEYLPALTR